MSRMLGWLRRLIEEPDDVSLDSMLASDRAPAAGSLPSARRPLVLDLACLEARAKIS